MYSKQIYLPDINEGFTPPKRNSYLFVLAAGFEDRTFNILKNIKNNKPSMVLVIKYKGEGYTNKDTEINEYLLANKIPFSILEFDRLNPQDFEDSLQDKITTLKNYSEIVVDISSMSKLLIMTLIVNMRNINQPLTIVYTEAKIYLPTEKQFQKQKHNKQIGASKLYFQTLDVSSTVTTRNLSSIAMADAPRFLVAFPTFNEDLLITLFQEFAPNAWLILHGIPHLQKDKWRTEAIKYINRHILAQVTHNQQNNISTYEYREVFDILERCYQQYKLTHKYIVGSPTSKLQAVGVSLFKLFRQDIQILYPTPKSYLLKQHSRYSGKIHHISFKDFSKYINDLLVARHKIDAA